MTHDGRQAVLLPESFQTDRLQLRQWLPEDLAAFAEMNADPEVMKFLPGVMTREDSDHFQSSRIDRHFLDYGYGPWAVERKDTNEFIGYVGLMWQTFDSSFTPALEVGWRLARQHWGRGFATEAGRRSLAIAFDVVNESEVVSMTVPQNTRSRAVMRRIGMTYDAADDFDHPRFGEGDALRRHVLHRMSQSQWRILSEGAST